MAVAKHTSGFAEFAKAKRRALIHVRKERKFRKPGSLSCLKRSLFCGGRNFNCVKDVIVASLKGAIFVGSAANDLFVSRAFLSCIVDWSGRPNCSQKNTFGEKFNAWFPNGPTAELPTWPWLRSIFFSQD